MTYEQMIALFIEARVNFKKFYIHSHKSLADLHREVREEIELFYDKRTKRLIRAPRTVRIVVTVETIAYLLQKLERESVHGKFADQIKPRIDPIRRQDKALAEILDGPRQAGSYIIREKRRISLKGERILTESQEWSVRESLKHGQTPTAGIVHALAHELGVHVSDEKAEASIPDPTPTPAPERPSSVYWKIWTQETYVWAYITIDKHPWRGAKKKIEDSGLIVEFEKGRKD